MYLLFIRPGLYEEAMTKGYGETSVIKGHGVAVIGKTSILASNKVPLRTQQRNKPLQKLDEKLKESIPQSGSARKIINEDGTPSEKIGSRTNRV